MKSMKRAAALLLTYTALCAALTGCGSQQEQEDKQEQNVTSSVQEGPEQTPSGEPESAGTVFEQYEAGLEAQGISFEKVQMAAEIVGAAEGAKYKIGEGAVELYLFDKAGEAYAAAEEKQALTMEGLGDFPAKVENGMALVVSDLESDPYLEIFHTLTAAD